MDKFTVLEGVAAPLNMINVDTDAIIPKQYLKTIKRTGLGTGLFSEKRFKDDGAPGVRGESKPEWYGAYVRGPVGNKICAFYKG